MKGYARAIGCATSVAVELWALRDGIRLCISLKLPVVVFELDTKLVVDLLKKDMEKSNYIDELVADCRERLKEIPMVRIQHCYRETNKCVDALARKGALMDQNFTIFLIPPPNVVILLNLDLAGTFLIGLLLPLEFSLCIFNQKKKKNRYNDIKNFRNATKSLSNPNSFLLLNTPIVSSTV